MSEKAIELIDVKLLIEQLDTTKAGVKSYLEDAGQSLKCDPSAGKAHRLAVFRFIADTFKMSGAIRQEAWKQFNATHSSFGCNASAARQNILGLKAQESAVELDIEA